MLDERAYERIHKAVKSKTHLTQLQRQTLYERSSKLNSKKIHSEEWFDRIVRSVLVKDSGIVLRKNYPVLNKYFADYCCLEKQLIIEIDDASHELKSTQDEIRTRYLKTFGFKVLRINHFDATASDQLIELFGPGNNILYLVKTTKDIPPAFKFDELALDAFSSTKTRRINHHKTVQKEQAAKTYPTVAALGVPIKFGKKGVPIIFASDLERILRTALHKQ